METVTKRTYRRGERGRFAPGTAPGPGAPRKQRRDPKLERHALEIAKERIERMTAQALDVLQRQMNGEDETAAAAAARTVLGKTIADPPRRGSKVLVPELADPSLSLEQKAHALSAYLADGRISVEQHSMLTRALESQAKLADLERIQAILTLVRRGVALADALREVETRGVVIEHDPGQEADKPGLPPPVSPVSP